MMYFRWNFAAALLALGLARHIAPADAQQLGGLQLGEGRLTGQAVPQQHQLTLPGGQRLDQDPQAGRVVLFLAGFLHAGGVLQQIGQGQGRIILAGVEGFLQGDGGADLFFAAELHTDFICYPITADFLAAKDENEACGPHFDEKWRVFFRLGEHMYIMIRYVSEEVEFAPLFLSSFALLAPHQLLEAEKFNLRFPDPSGIAETADKLRWYRYKKALLQREAAAWIGVDCSTYQSYETVGRDYYPREQMEKLADLFEVPVTELLDAYNLFLYQDQGRQIKERCAHLHLTQSQYAAQLGITPNHLGKWENNKVRVPKLAWEKYSR